MNTRKHIALKLFRISFTNSVETYVKKALSAKYHYGPWTIMGY